MVKEEEEDKFKRSFTLGVPRVCREKEDNDESSTRPLGASVDDDDLDDDGIQTNKESSRPSRHHVRVKSGRHLEDDSNVGTTSSRTTTATTTTAVHSTPRRRLVVVRYFLDRPGYGLHNSACRFWWDAPAECTPLQVQEFLQLQGIALDGLLLEAFLDAFESFMMLEACQAAHVVWDFSQTSSQQPGILNIRLTDLYEAQAQELEPIVTTECNKHQQHAVPAPTIPRANTAAAPPPSMANTIPAGLFSFSMMVGLETAALTGELITGSVQRSFVLSWGPYMFFVGGLLQIIVACFQVYRNNIYGTVAFLGFGSFWFANGLTSILQTYFLDTDVDNDDDNVNLATLADPWGRFIRTFFVLAFSCSLLQQTFVMSRLSSTLIFLLCLKVGAAALGGWSRALQWCQFVFGWTTSAFAFYVFLVEFTNQVYHREVFKTYKWSEDNSPEEVFGASGKLDTLHSKAARLRQARYQQYHQSTTGPTNNVRKVREACSSSPQGSPQVVADGSDNTDTRNPIGTEANDISNNNQ